ncbi:MAG: GNAT family N-acetyltransferase [Clostridia bacterium]|nr:GNAT family N-acetyltransferase [Clostridia bacterium]
MEIRIDVLKPQDEVKAMQFAMKGMHFERYLENMMLRKLYTRYFWYLESGKATQIIAAYEGDRLLGVLLSSIRGEKRKGNSVWRRLYISLVDFVQKHFFREGVGPYDNANKKMLARYKKTNDPDGEIVFLAADPDSGVKGVGTALLSELEKREQGKKIYLYTDTGCTYQFYEHRGFERVGEEDIDLELNGSHMPLKCLLYSKVIPKV